MLFPGFMLPSSCLNNWFALLWPLNMNSVIVLVVISIFVSRRFFCVSEFEHLRILSGVSSPVVYAGASPRGIVLPHTLYSSCRHMPWPKDRV